MIFLLNRERVIMEILELAKLKIALRLKIPESDIVAGVVLDKDKKLIPDFKINTAVVGNDKAYAEALADVWGNLRKELQARLDGLGDSHYAA